MTSEKLGQIIHRDIVYPDQPNVAAVIWAALTPDQRERYCQVADAVVEAYTAATFGPQCSIVVTDYLAALERLARCQARWADLPDHAETIIANLDIIKERDAALVALRAYPDWQRKGAQHDHA